MEVGIHRRGLIEPRFKHGLFTRGHLFLVRLGGNDVPFREAPLELVLGHRLNEIVVILKILTLGKIGILGSFCGLAFWRGRDWRLLSRWRLLMLLAEAAILFFGQRRPERLLLGFRRELIDAFLDTRLPAAALLWFFFLWGVGRGVDGVLPSQRGLDWTLGRASRLHRRILDRLRSGRGLNRRWGRLNAERTRNLVE